jgi:hypothetical protein
MQVGPEVAFLAAPHHRGDHFFTDDQATDVLGADAPMRGITASYPVSLRPL